jgi:hypothetical protein
LNKLIAALAFGHKGRLQAAVGSGVFQNNRPNRVRHARECRIPIFVAMTASNLPPESNVIAGVAAQTVAVVLLVSALLGERVLEIFGISIASFSYILVWW